jgi:glycine cleavage system H protein
VIQVSEYLEIKVDKFTFKVAADRYYNAEGVWAFASGSIIRIGISDYLQQHSGDIAFAEVKSAGTELAAGDEVAAVETIKVNISLPSPVSGKIIRVNPLMENTPETINQDPYGKGWLCEIDVPEWGVDIKHLLTAAAYFDKMKHEAENEARRDG